MVFSATVFLFAFLPFTILVYYILPNRLRNPFLLVASLLFYTWGSGALVLLLVVSTLVDYAAGAAIDRNIGGGNRRRARLALAVSILVNLVMLSYFKYANFIVEQINLVADSFGIGPVVWTSVVLPIGISFFTFQSMSYSIDVYTGRAKRIRKLGDFALYVSLFPQLVAGPIVRFHEIADEIVTRDHTWTRFSTGMQRFAWGLSKKVLVADSAATVADAVFALPQGSQASSTAWVGVLAYTIQIYFDFSGYSDMAIGLGRVFGFEFPENFRRPYSSVSVTDFWRRWHMTLSHWFRDYLYIPLGGSRGSPSRTAANLWFVFLVVGFWHGAAWTFVVWGTYHGALLTIERLLGQRRFDVQGTSERTLRRLIVILVVTVGWVVFRAPSVPYAASMLGSMIGIGPGDSVIEVARSSLLGLGLGSLVLILPGSPIGPRIGRFRRPWQQPVFATSLVLVVLPVTLVRIMAGTFSPFIYFQF